MITKFLTFVLIAALLISIVYPLVMGVVGLVVGVIVFGLVVFFAGLMLGAPIAIIQQTWSEIFKR